MYIKYENLEVKVVVGNVNDIEYRIYDDMVNVFIKDLFLIDFGFDMNMYILCFELGGCYLFVEIYV